MTFLNKIAVLLSLGLFVVVLLKFPLEIGIRIFKPHNLLGYLKIGILLTTWCFLMVLKVDVNESINPYHIGRISEGRRLLGYFLFSIWSSILLWESFYMISNWYTNKRLKKSL